VVLAVRTVPLGTYPCVVGVCFCPVLWYLVRMGSGTVEKQESTVAAHVMHAKSALTLDARFVVTSYYLQVFGTIQPALTVQLRVSLMSCVPVHVWN
jgi:hypothetical protein